MVDPHGWRQADLAVVGLSSRVPARWHGRRLSADLGPYNQHALIISNHDFNVDARSAQYPTLWDMSKQRSDLVAVIIGNLPEFSPCSERDDSPLPYGQQEVRDLENWQDDFAWQDAGSLYGYATQIDHQVLATYLWLGREASLRDMTLGAAAVTTVQRIAGSGMDCKQTWRSGWARVGGPA
jgi:hypothetical protein